MNRTLSQAMAIVSTSALMVGLVGCDLSDKEKEVVATNAGLIASTTWIAVDNPDAEDIANVRSTVGVLRGSLAVINEGQSVSTALYPIASDWIVRNLDPNERPLALAGVTVLLTSLDLYFVKNNPEDVSEAVVLTDAFLDGVEQGLSLAPNSVMMLTARKGYEVRSEAFKVNSKVNSTVE